MEKISNKIVMIISVALICLLTSFALCSCNLFDSGSVSSDRQKADITTYFGEVNAIAKEFTNIFSSFKKDAKEKNVSVLQEKQDQAQDLINQFNQIPVPEGCEDVHDSYEGAFNKLQQALSDYIQVYSDFNDGQVDKSTLNQRIADIQKSYKEAMELLSKADKIASRD